MISEDENVSVGVYWDDIGVRYWSNMRVTISYVVFVAERSVRPVDFSMERGECTWHFSGRTRLPIGWHPCLMFGIALVKPRVIPWGWTGTWEEIYRAKTGNIVKYYRFSHCQVGGTVCFLPSDSRMLPTCFNFASDVWHWGRDYFVPTVWFLDRIGVWCII